MIKNLRFKNIKLFLILLVYLLTSSCNEVPNSTNFNFNGDRAFKEVSELIKFSPRDAGTKNGHLAAYHIATKLKKIGLKVIIDEFIDNTPVGSKKMINILGYIPGKSDKWIILGSHFDTMPGIPNFKGANDSGSSTGVLIEMARLLNNYELNHGLIFAFFDGEEGIANYVPGDGLHGSRRFAKQIYKSGNKNKYIAMILLDMIGDKDLTYTIPSNSDKYLKEILIESSKKLNIRNLIELLDHIVIIDDHVPFSNIGIPSIDIIDFKYGSTKDNNDYWHTEKDSLINISSNSLRITAELTLEMLNHLGVF